MVHGSGKISGHSGTEFKHRKGFAQRKAQLSHRQRLGGGVVYEKKEFQFEKQPVVHFDKRYGKSSLEKISHLLIYVIFAVLLTLCLAVAKEIPDVSGALSVTPKSLEITTFHPSFESAEHENAFQIALQYGEAHFLKGHLYEAQTEIHRALEILPKSAKANRLMTQILVHRCVTMNEVCTEAEAYLDVLNKNPIPTLEEKRFIQNLYIENSKP
ncbi:MAG: hypothetical protein AB8G22_08930 [Saprospiraceae bacterium]